MHAPQSFAEWHYALPGGPCCGSCCSSPAQATPEAALAATAAKVSTSGWCLPKFHQLSQAVLMSWHRLLVAGGRSGRGSQSLRLTAAVAVAVAAGLSLLQAAAAPLHPGHRSDRHYFPANQQHHGCHLPRPLQLRAGQCTASAAMPTACLRGLCKRHAASVKAAKSPTPPWPNICLLPCLCASPSPLPCYCMQVKAFCKIEGEHAVTSTPNWPAQVQLCGPTGGEECQGISYNASAPTLTPSK